MVLVIILRFLLVKKLVSIKTAHALYRDHGPLSHAKTKIGLKNRIVGEIGGKIIVYN